MSKAFSLYKEQADVLSDCVFHIVNNRYARAKDQIMILGANAGTGKTYTANVLCQTMKAFGYTGVAIAFTGKAVTQLKKSGIPARTFHSLMYTPVIDETTGDCIDFKRRTISEVLAEAGSFIVLDESSMIPKNMWEDLKTIGLPIIALGDYAQLPPIDQNNPEFNVMHQDHPHIKLTVNRRTDPSLAGIVKLSNHFRENNTIPRISGNGLSFIYKRQLDVSYFRENDFDGILVGTNKMRKNITSKVRSAKDIDTSIPTIGENIMCLKNTMVDSGATSLSNGELFRVEAVFEGDKSSKFIIRSIDDPTKTTTIQVINDYWTTEKMPIMRQEDRAKYQEFTFGYCFSVWKAQGSSLNRVLFVDEDVSFFADQQKFRYTAVSRAAKELVYAR